MPASKQAGTKPAQGTNCQTRGCPWASLRCECCSLSCFALISTLAKWMKFSLIHVKCCILIFPLPCSHKTKRSRLGTAQSIIPGKENLWQTYICHSQQGHANFSVLRNFMDACWVCNEAIEMLVCQLSMNVEKLKSDKIMSVIKQ